MRIRCIRGEEAHDFITPLPRVIAGRPRSGQDPPDLDLSPDQTVSRPHLAIWVDAAEAYWVEDLGSTHGTRVNDAEIKGLGAQRLWSGDQILAGETLLEVEVPDTAPSNRAGDGDTADAFSGEDLDARITSVIPAGAAEAAFVEGTPEHAATAWHDRRLSLLYELLLQFGTATRLDDLLQTTVSRVVEAIPNAVRGALLLTAPEGEAMLLKAYRSPSGPVVSETLARRAMRERIGFIWSREEEGDIGQSILQFHIESGMYAPLLWQGVPLGVLAVDNPDALAFNQDDLAMLMTVAHYLAMALANQKLQEELRYESAVKANLLRQFSPRVAEQLVKSGSLQLSGERTEVVILCSDIRGFTRLSQRMEPLDVMQLLNDYFGRLIPVIFAHGGTVDKYMGDAILAVFGGGHQGTSGNPYEEAARAAIDMQAVMERFNEARSSQGKITCHIGIGVHCGEVLQGFIGVLDRMEFTVIGEVVNLASRYCDGAGPGQVLVSPQVYQYIWKKAEAEPVTIRTKHEGELQAMRISSIREYEQTS